MSEATAKLITKSAPWQYRDSSHLDSGQVCNVVYRGLDKYGMAGPYVVLRFPPQTYRLCDNPRYYQPVRYGVFKLTNLVQTGPDTYEQDAECIKIFEALPYTAQDPAPVRLRNAKTYADDCTQLGEATARAIYMGVPTRSDHVRDTLVGPNQPDSVWADEYVQANFPKNR